MRNKIFRISFKILSLTVVGVLILVFFVVKINENYASKNLLVNVSKRFVAELGAFTAKFVYPHKERQDISFGPGRYNEPQTSFCNNKENSSYLLSDNSGIQIEDFYNYGISKYAYNFDYEDFHNPKLILLRNKYHLKELTEGAGDEFEKILILRKWVKKKISHGEPQNVDYNFDALDILERAEKGEGFFCSEQATVFIQCALSLGLIPRYVGLFKGHAVCEIWSNQFAKWIIVDVANDLHYEKEGIPLNALELHNCWETGNYKEIRVVKSPKRKICKEKMQHLSYYHEFFIRMRNDWFSNRYPHWYPKANSIMNSLEWQDEYTANNILVSEETHSSERIYFPLNVTEISVARTQPEDNRIDLHLATFTPNFSHFDIWIDGNILKKQNKSTFIWRLHKGNNNLKVCAVNSLGIKGPESRIDLILN